jgi:hypothetical protein
MNARHMLFIALVAFGITLAILIGLRLSTEALAILLGVVIGVAASLPSTLILAWTIQRQPPATTPTPAITVVSVPPLASLSLPPAPPPFSLTPSSKRQFVVIGGDELMD